MGDTGSLALGGLLAAIAMVLHAEIIFVVVAGVFIAETVSDIIQVLHYKRTKTRVFLMAPLHHHYEKKGWDENKVVRVFWLWGIFFAILGIALAVA
jgi:phospho-N-acetylmuramoyl-pentapeptide-transferase